MKLRILAMAVVAFSGMLLAVLPAAAAPPCNPGSCPQDHTWTVTYGSTTLNANADIKVVLNLGQLGPAEPGGGVPDTSFFHDATTRYAGVVPTPGNPGDNVGTIDF